MTIVTGFLTDDFALMSADSRLSGRTELDRYDCCQKIFPLTNAAMMGVAGDLDALAAVLTIVYRQRSEGVSIDLSWATRTLLPTLRAIWSRLCAELRRPHVEIGLMFAGRSPESTFEMFYCFSPEFSQQSIQSHSYGVLGSGIPAITRKQAELADVMAQLTRTFERWRFDSSQALGWMFGNILDSYLRNSGFNHVGRIFHTCLLDRRDVWAIPYEIQPPGSSASIGTRVAPNGRFVQFRSDGKEIPLIHPIDLQLSRTFKDRPWVLDCAPADDFPK